MTGRCDLLESGSDGEGKEKGNGPVGVRTFEAEELCRQWPVAGTQRLRESL